MGVDTSRYALLIGDGVYTPLVLVKLLCFLSVCFLVFSSKEVCYLVCMDYLRHGYVLYRKRIIQDMCVNNLYLQG